MKLTLIAEGSTKWQRFIRRWGVSFLLGDDVIFDTFGRADVFWHNIGKFRIDTKRIKYLVISHEDWDHIAGLAKLLKFNRNIAVYVCRQSNQRLKDQVNDLGASLVEVDKSVQISGSVYSLGEMSADTKQGVIYEQSLAIKTEKGISVITGCAHPGVMKIIKKVCEQYGENIYAIIGGFHMKDISTSQGEIIVNELQGLGAKVIMPLHCTGKRATETIREVFGNNFIRLREGDILEL